MAVVVVAFRGIKHEVDWLVRDLQAQYSPFEMEVPGTFKTVRGAETPMTTKIVQPIQWQVRPLQLYEIVVPEPAVPELLKTLGIKATFPKVWHKLDKYLKLIRSILRLEPIPEVDEKVKPKVMFLAPNVQKLGIGWRRDKHGPTGPDMIKQERI